VLHRVRIARRSLVHHLAYNDDVAAGRLAVFRGGPSRTGNKAPIPGFIGAGRAMRKNGQLVAARRVALKMGRRPRCAVRTRSLASLVAGHMTRNAHARMCGGASLPSQRLILNTSTSPLYARRYTGLPMRHRAESSVNLVRCGGLLGHRFAVARKDGLKKRLLSQ